MTFQGSEDPLRHAAYVWENYVMAADPSKVAIVAHSFGGMCTIGLVIWHILLITCFNAVLYFP